MKRLAFVALAAALSACITPPPPMKIPPPQPQLPPLLPNGTRPLPSDLDISGCFGYRCIIWGEVATGRWTMGPYAPQYAPALCQFNPSRGDQYRSESNGVVLAAPEGCPS